jgi:glycosyltransferase involved in cell wall biosynthesis
MLSICAVIATRNESQYLRILLPLLADQEIDVAIIDNDSTDGSQQLYTEYAKNPITISEMLPFKGYYSLPDLLRKINQVVQLLNHDWVIYANPDEIMQNRRTGYTLRNAIEEADANGFNALNFEEFVFLPHPAQDYRGKDYVTNILRYYFFRPSENRLNRAWKNGLGLDNFSSGGHRLIGNQLRISPINHVLRHYIVLGYEHAKDKYLNRIYDIKGLEKGWHGNRRNFTEDNLTIPFESEFLYMLETPGSNEFCRDKPTPKHYWEWQK